MQIKYCREKYELEKAFDELESIFSDKQIELVANTEREFVFEIRLPSLSSWYVDSEIQKLSQSKLKKIPEFYFLKENNQKIYLNTYFHYNALIGAEKYEKISGNNIDCIIHFDDHSDMMPIYKKNGDFLSYNEKIRNGELAIGNFLTNYLTRNCIDIYHIQNPLSFAYFEDKYNYSIIENEVSIGDSTFKKIEVQKSSETYNSYSRMSLNNFMHTKINYENIWLDIDLDYFCNRFNRNSNWKEIQYFDRTFNELENDIRNFIDGLGKCMWLENVKVLTIASSPGFFPFEYLEYIETNLINQLLKVIGFESI